MKFLELIDQHSEFVQNLHRKLAPPLVTLLSAEPEIQYVALRNINLIVQKRYRNLGKSLSKVIRENFTFLDRIY